MGTMEISLTRLCFFQEVLFMEQQQMAAPMVMGPYLDSTRQ